MSPRDYNLGKRAASVEATRRKIVQAAAEVLAEEGFDASYAAIARRADVAPGTVRYRFPDREQLVLAALQDLMRSLALPDLSILDGASSLDERLERTAVALFGFFERSEHLFPFYQAAREHSQAVRDANAEFEQRYLELLQATLGEHATRPQAMQVVPVLLGPVTESNLRRSGLPSDEAARITARMLAGWLQDR